MYHVVRDSAQAACKLLSLLASSPGADTIDMESHAMNDGKLARSRWGNLAAICATPALLMLTGCQVEMAGQTLPSPYYLSDDVQYYAPGPGFKLAREAAALKEQSEAQQSEAQDFGP